MIRSLLQNRKSWMDSKGSESDIVLSTRIRLARNIFPYPFPYFASEFTLSKVEEEIIHAIERIGGCFENVVRLPLQELTELEKQLLMEEHFISREYLHTDVQYIYYCPKEAFSVLINEEDHFRIQVIVSGLELLQAYKIVEEKDRLLAAQLNYSYHARYGFLTTCPTNVGTGLRASAMVHLPGLAMNMQLNEALTNANKLGIVCRGAYGEGSKSTGYMFQVSNQRTMGLRELEIIGLVGYVTKSLVVLEKQAREYLWEKKREELLDKIWRAFGTLRYCYQISINEALELLSLVRLGVAMNIISNIPLKDINRLTFEIQNAHLKLEKNVIHDNKNDIYSFRAKIIRETLNKEQTP